MSGGAESGRAAEERAARFLEERGLRLLERNFRARGGELDLVAQDGAEAVFVEVRFRASSDYGGAAASVTAAKRRRLVLAARAWIARRGWEGPCRFDVVAVDGEALEHIPAAFEAA